MAIHHFAIVVLQQSYDQYNNFNFLHLFLTSVGLLLGSWVCKARYWVLSRNTAQVDTDCI